MHHLAAMGRRARSNTSLAVWGALGLGFASILGLGAYGLFQQAAYQQDAQDKAADYGEHAGRQIQQTCTRLPSPMQARCVANRQAEYDLKARDNRREYDDLVAQRKSALWTFIMGMAALIGMALSAIGVLLVKQTFDETRRTNRIAMRENARATRRAVASARDTEAALAIAVRNADAAAAQVKVAKDIGEAQVRSYLSIADVFMGLHNGNVPMITLRVNNAGQSPALNLSAKIKLYWIDLNGGGLERQIVGGSGPVLATIPAGAQEHGLLYDMKGGFQSDELEQLQAGGPVIFLAVNVSLKWIDVFGGEGKLWDSYIGAFPLPGQAGFWRLGTGSETLSTVQAEQTRRRATREEETDHQPPPDEEDTAE